MTVCLRTLGITVAMAISAVLPDTALSSPLLETTPDPDQGPVLAAERLNLLSPDPEQGVVSAPPPLEARWLGAFRVTYYWVACEDERFDGAPRDTVLRDVAGGSLAAVPAAFRRELDREGTGRLRDGRVLNVGRRVDGEWRYVDLGRGAWGTGSAGVALEPFASVAVDPARVPLGARLFVPAFEGQPLPDGRCHPGRFRAEDRGSAIREARLDVFIGDVRNLPAWEDAVPSHEPADVFVLDGETSAEECPE